MHPKFRSSFVAALLMFAGPALPAQAFSLSEVEQDVTEDYPGIAHVMPDAVIGKPAGKDVVLFDVREAGEFAVSRLPGAVRIQPGMSAAKFIAQYGAMTKGKQVVFYCSVGVRSSKFAEAVKKQLAAQGASGVANLTGGIFRWHNERRTLENGAGQTDIVHPYNRRWGQLVNRKSQLRYSPDK